MASVEWWKKTPRLRRGRLVDAIETARDMLVKAGRQVGSR
jgi:hypothetical protein